MRWIDILKCCLAVKGENKEWDVIVVLDVLIIGMIIVIISVLIRVYAKMNGIIMMIIDIKVAINHEF